MAEPKGESLNQPAVTRFSYASSRLAAPKRNKK
jgi:hypothetical protein